MSLSCNSSSSSGALVSKIAPAFLSFLYPIESVLALRHRSPRKHRALISRRMISITEGFEAWFINSLASAGNCQQHSPVKQTSISLASRRPCTILAGRQTYQTDAFRRQLHTQTLRTRQAEVKKEPSRTKEELLALVDQYDGRSFTDQLPILEPPNLHQPGDGPHLTVSDNIQDEWPPPQHAWPADPPTKTKLKALDDALRDVDRDPEEIYKLYRDLPAPRVPYLESRIRHKLLRHLSIVERKDEQSMLRYLSIVDDMKVTAIPLSVNEWTSAISFAARYVSHSTEVEVEAALHMWKDMEHVAGVKGNEATFNVLFDVACKAGKFRLAEMIYKEMRSRGLEYNRFHYVSLIHVYGLKGDGDGVRAAYKALVDAGEIVDTVVLNAMISGLLTAHEANAAENIYERMKRAYIGQTGSKLPPKNYKDRRKLNTVLMVMAKDAKLNPHKREEMQRESIIAPDLQTYRILIKHFAVRAGELHKTTQFLDEMKFFDLPIHGAMFLALLQGFACHGGIRYTHWTEDRLESVWRAFIHAIEAEVEDLYISRWMAIWALRAFAKCSGKSRMIDVWEELKQKWNPQGDDLDFVMEQLRHLLDDEDMLEKRNDWLLGSL